MTTEVTTDLEQAPQPPTLTDVETDSAPLEREQTRPKPPPPRKTAPEERESREKSKVWQALQAANDKSLRELIESFGTDASYQIKIERKEPDQFFDPVTARSYNTGGFQGKFENKIIDEEFIKERYGGGTYALRFMDKDARGSWQFARQITIRVTGDPNLTEYRVKAGFGANGNATGNGQPAATTDNPSVVKDAMAMVRDQLSKAEERAERAADRGGGSDVMELVREQLAASRTENVELRRQLSEFMSRPPTPSAPARSPIEEKMFSALLEGDSARNTNLREMHNSEISALKTAHSTELKLVADRFERLMEDQKRSHQQMLDSLKASHEMSLSSAKASFETQLAAAKGSFELQIKLLESENRKLDSDNKELRSDNKDLRAKKDLDLVDMVKKIESVKDALGAGDDEETSTAGKIVEAVTNPGFFEGVAGMINQLKPAQAPAQQPQQQAEPARTGRQIVRDKTTGKRFLLENGELKGPLPDKKPKKKVDGEAGAELGPAEPALPEVDPGQLAMVINLLESAFSGGQEPEIVAQSNRSRVPEDLLAAIRDHGIDAVVTKVAKLSSSSPLSSQAGRNWLRKLGKELVGE